MLDRFFSRVNERPTVTYLIVALVLTSDHYILGPFSFVEWHDLGNAHFARYAAIADAVRTHGVFYWYPFAGTGVDMQSNGFRFADIYFLSFIVLPDWLVIPVLRLAQLMLAGWSTHRLCRDSLALTPEASLAGGLFYMFAQLNFMEHYFGLGALPLVVWSLERLHARRHPSSWAWVLLLGLAYGFCAHLHLTIAFTVVGLLAWMVLVCHLRDGRTLALLIVFFAGCLVAQADMVIAMLANAPISQRTGHLPGSAALTAGDLAWLGDAAVRYLPLIVLVLFGLALAGRGGRMPLGIAASIVAFSVIAIVDRPVRAGLGDVLGPFRGFHMNRFGEQIPFFLSVGAAAALDDLRLRLAGRGGKGTGRRTAIGAVFVGALGYMAVHPIGDVAGNVHDWVTWGGYTANFRSPNMEALGEEMAASAEPFRMATIQENGLQPGYASAYGLESADGYINLYPAAYHRFWGLVIEPFLNRHEDAERYFRGYGVRPSLFTDDGHGLTVDVTDYFRVSLLSLANVRYVVTTVPLDSPHLTLVPETRPDRIWDSLGRGEKLRRRLHENFTGRHVMVYRNETVVPRWFLAGASVLDDRERLDHALRERSADALRQTALFTGDHEDSLDGIPERVPAGTAEPVTYAPDRIELRVTADAPAVLVVSNAVNPFWRCRVDGESRPILAAYGTFWGVPVAAGSHTVVFEYDPPHRWL